MIRALYTAASGMAAQQANIDNVAHNLANVNTTGFKKSRMEFEDLVYETTRTAGTPTSASTEAPVGLETGLGTRAVATARDFTRATSSRPAARSTSPSRATGSFRSPCRTAPPPTPGRRVPPRRRRQAAEQRRHGAAAGNHRAAQRDVGQHLEGRRGLREPGRPECVAADRHHRARHVPERGRHARAGRQSLRRHHRLRRSRRPACRAPTVSAAPRRAFSRSRTSAWSKRWST